MEGILCSNEVNCVSVVVAQLAQVGLCSILTVCGIMHTVVDSVL